MKSKVQSNQSVGTATAEIGDGEILDKLGVGTRLRIKPRTVNAWMRRGLLPYYKLGRLVRFKWKEVEAHHAERCRVCRELTKAGI